MRKNSFILFGLVAFMSLVLIACGGSDNGGKEESSGEGTSEETEAKEQSLVFANDSDIIGLSPIDTSQAGSGKVIAQIYETLFVRNPETFEIEPHLVDTYEAVDDLTWVFELKQGIKFHDGTDFNAEAVKYTFEQLLDPERAAPRSSFLSPIDTIEVLDEYTLEITTKEPYGLFLTVLAHYNTAIVSPTADQEGDIETENPVGTGPFMFDEWIPGDSVKLVKNPNYWQEGVPTLDTFELKVVPEFSTAVSMLETGEIDFIDNLRAEHLSRLQSLDHVEVELNDGAAVFFIAFNFDKEPFNNIEFRKAVTHAINVPVYVEQLEGLGVYNKSFVGPNIFGYKEEAQDAGHDYDLEKAKQIVEENGFGDETYKLLLQNGSNYMTMAEIVQTQLAEAGINIELEVMDSGAYFDASVSGNYEMGIMGWTNTNLDGSDLLYNHHSDNMEMENRLNYNDETYDALVDESRVTIDPDERAELIHQANVYALEDYQLVPMYHEVVSMAYKNDVTGIEISPDGSWKLNNAKRE